MEPINNHGYHLRDVTGSTSIDTDTYSYDANGNLVSHNGRSYTWTSDNLPTSPMNTTPTMPMVNASRARSTA
jgi:cytochrome c2